LAWEGGDREKALELICEAKSMAPDMLAHAYWECVMLAELDKLAEAEAAMVLLIARSEEVGDPFFLDEVKIRLAQCLKLQKKMMEFSSIKAEIDPNLEVYIGNELHRAGDL